MAADLPKVGPAPLTPALAGLGEAVDGIRRQVLAILQASTPLPQSTRAELERLRVAIDELAARSAEMVRADLQHSERIHDILDALFRLAQLDFSRPAEVQGDGPLAAIAASANMLAEELNATLESLASAKEAADNATAAKTRFLANMSHEIRTPLTAMLGFADLLGAAHLSDSDRLNYAMLIHRNGEHLLSVINDILDLSRVEAGKLALEHIDLSPAHVLSDVTALLQVRAVERGLRLDVALETPIPAVVRGDPTRLRQVLLNLVGNAIKFTPNGTVSITARFDAASSELVYTVRDTGVGMSPEQVASLFAPFEQGDVTMTRRFGGSGLGLAISKLLVDAFDGTIEVDSTLGMGSTFTVRLRVQVPADAAFVSVLDAPAPESAEPVARLTGSVLLAEDGPDSQLLIATLLRQLGLEVAVAPNGEMAVEHALPAWRKGRPLDLVLMDMQMPLVDGYEATRRLRRAGYPFPIVALTAHAMVGERERCLEAGCDEYQRKPVERAAFSAMLERFLPRRSVADAETVWSTFAADADMKELVTRFVTALPARLDAMRLAHRENRQDDLRRLAHHLKGSAGGYGFSSVSEAAARLEQALLETRDAEAHTRELSRLDELCGRVRDGEPPKSA